MSDNFKWLQFFADGGASGGDGGSGGAGTGVSSADAGQNAGVQADDAGQRLEALGVPRDKVEKYRRQMAKKASGRRLAEQKPAPGQNDGAKAEAAPPQNDAEKREEAGKVMPPWDEYMQVPENKQRLESMMAARGRIATEERTAANELMAQFAPALELLGARYGQEAKDGQYDIGKLVEAITGDDLFFEDKALETGESVDKVRDDWKKEREDAQKQQREREQMLRDRFMEMQRQVPIVQQEYPNFDFNKEMGNPEFVHLANSRELGGMGWDLRRAFRAVHQDDIERSQAEAIAQRVKSDTARVVQSNQARPRENGNAAAKVAPAHDYASARAMFRNMTPEERLAYVKNLRPPG